MGILLRDIRSSFSCFLNTRKNLLQTIINRNIHRNSRNHYDALGLTPKASQADIKKAYYKLSLLHHPDTNPVTESHEKFQEINAAYEILGNLKLRRLYDKGMLTGENFIDPVSGTSTVYEAEPSGSTTEPNKFKARNQKVPMSGRTSAYNYDDWSRAHYGVIFDQQVKRQATRKIIEERKTQEKADMQTEGLIFFLAFTLIFMLACSGNFLSDWDKPRPKQEDVPPKKKDNT